MRDNVSTTRNDDEVRAEWFGGGMTKMLSMRKRLDQREKKNQAWAVA